MARKRKSIHSSGFTILVVDDQEETLASTRALLEQEGHTILSASSGKEALAVFRPGEVHLLLTDYIMPNMNGEELIRAIRERDSDVQILLQTGYAGEKPPREMLRTLEIQGYHDKSNGPDSLLVWVDVGLKASVRLQAVRETEQLKMQVLLKEEALAKLCHEMRTPLQIMSGYSEMLRDHTDPEVTPDVCQELDGIQHNTQTLEFFTDDFLYFVQLEAGTQVVMPESIERASLEAAIEDCVQCLFRESGMAVSWQVKSTLPPVWSDRNILLIVLRHVLLDAVKDAIPTRIQISANQTAEGERVALQVAVVTQEGPTPLGRSVMSKGVFGTTRFGQGHMGFQLAQRFVGLLAGELTAEQLSARQTRYTLTLPLAASHSTAQPSFPHTHVPPPQPTFVCRLKERAPLARKRVASEPPGFTILVIDDQAEVLAATRGVLELSGHHVLTAQSGEEALAILRTSHVHLIIVDYFMPGMDGETVIRHIRDRDPEVQILLQTGYAGEKPPREMLRTLDIQGYHNKTDGPEQLQLWVDVALKSSAQLQQVRETEQLKARLILKEEALASLCRSMRFPLHAIFESSGKLLQGSRLPAAPEYMRWMERIQRQSHFLEFLVDDLLNFAEIETNGVQVSPQRLHLSELQEEVQELMDFLLRGKTVSFVWQVSDQLQPVWADREALVLILRNLLTNAAKFTTDGQIRLEAVHDPQAGSVVVHVSDTGVGIAPEYHEQIFQLFRQASEPATPPQPGAGIGLTLARNLAELMGGTLSVESSPGEGALFSLAVPLSSVSGRSLRHRTPSLILS